MSEARMLRPEEWETFREGYRLKKCWISYWRTTRDWATANGLKIPGQGVLSFLFGIWGAIMGAITLALVGVPVNLWLGEPLFGLGWIVVGALLGLIIGAVKGSEKAFRRAFASWLLADENIYKRAIMNSGIDIWYSYEIDPQPSTGGA